MILRSIPALAVVAAFALPACGGETPAASTAKNPAPIADGNVAVRPPTPENVPNTPTAAAVNIDERIRRACGIADNEAYFAFDSSRVRSSDTRVLDKVAACFTTGALAGQALRLVGHADPRGPASYNRELGLSRADSVKHYVASKGVKNLDSTSRGSDDATGSDESGWAKDRRVDVLLAN